MLYNNIACVYNQLGNQLQLQQLSILIVVLHVWQQNDMVFV